MNAKHRTHMLRSCTALLTLANMLYWQVTFGFKDGVPAYVDVICSMLYAGGITGIMWGMLLIMDGHCKRNKIGKYKVST